MSDASIASQVVWRVRLDHAVRSVRQTWTIADVAEEYHIDLEELERAVAERGHMTAERVQQYALAQRDWARSVPLAASTTSALEGLVRDWRAALGLAGFEESERRPRSYRWRRETPGLKMTLKGNVFALGRVGTSDVVSDHLSVSIEWSVSVRDGGKWRRIDQTGRTLFSRDVQGDDWDMHEGRATTSISGWDKDVLDELRSLGTTFAALATELADRRMARHFAAALSYTQTLR